MNIPNNFNEMVHAHMESVRLAHAAGYDAGHAEGFERGWQAALAEALAIVKPLADSSQAIIDASREVALCRLQA